MKPKTIKYFVDREAWRAWLAVNFETEDEVYLAYPLKKSGKQRILYNDAVEVALCFGWIDSTLKSLDESTSIQRFCKRRKKSSFSQANIERLRWLTEHDLLHDSIVSEARTIVQRTFIFPDDILSALQSDQVVWTHYERFSAPYKRIRIAYIDSARKRPAEFQKRLNNFMSKTRENKQIKGFGGIEKYY